MAAPRALFFIYGALLLGASLFVESPMQHVAKMAGIKEIASEQKPQDQKRAA